MNYMENNNMNIFIKSIPNPKNFDFLNKLFKFV